jgi:hypothetical protein
MQKSQKAIFLPSRQNYPVIQDVFSWQRNICEAISPKFSIFGRPLEGSQRKKIQKGLPDIQKNILGLDILLQNSSSGI